MSEDKSQDIKAPLIEKEQDILLDIVEVEEKPVGDGKKTLTRQQVNQAIMDIEDLHPLRDIATFDHIVPFLSFCRKYKCCRKKLDFQTGLRRTLLWEIGGKIPKKAKKSDAPLKEGEKQKMVGRISIPKSELELGKDPFLLLGYGINAYFDIIMSLVWGMLLISIFTFPLLYGYSNNSTKGLAAQSKYAINQFTLGNMGGASVFCAQKRIGEAEMVLTCPNGNIDTDNLMFGVINQNTDTKIFCTEKAIWAANDVKSVHNCTSNVDEHAFKNQIKTMCTDKKTCNLDITNMFTQSTSASITGGSGACNKDAFVYVQTPCLIPEKLRTERRIFGLIISCIGVFVYLFTVVYFDYVKTVQSNNYVDWDVKTITAGDYSIEFDIDQDAYERWQAKYYDEGNPISEVAQFKIYLQGELEKRINAEPDLGYDPSDERDYWKTCAQITFAYNNAVIVQHLINRGAAIKAEKWDKVHQIETLITDQLGDEESPLVDQLQRPVSAFVTWESEEAVNRAVQYSEDPEERPQLKFLGQELELQQASEPTDIIWENRHFTPRQRLYKRVIVLFIIAIMLSCSAAIIYKCTVISLTDKAKYPIVDCATVKANYAKRSAGEWEIAAVQEYEVNYEYEQAGKATHYVGNMQCFCQNEKAKGGEGFAKNFTLSEGGKVTYSAAICPAYFRDVLVSKIFGSSIAFLIIIINVILKTVIIKSITWVGEDTLSEQLSSITNGVFAAQFFNTGILLLLVNGNLTEHDPIFITKYLKGPFYDYMPLWYVNVGEKVVQTMIINSILPYVGLTTAFVIPWLKRKIDRKFGDDLYTTKKTSMAQYKDLYSGADYVIHFKCSGVINIVWITMMYGVGLPILFPVACFNFFNQYICERILVCYTVKLPPALDDQLTNNALSKIAWAPLLFLMNGYWMLSNPEIFQNRWEYIQTSVESMKSQHFLFPITVNWATPIEFMAFCAVFIILTQKIFGTLLNQYGYGMEREEIEVDEDLPDFFKCVKLSQADEVIAEEANMQNKFGFLVNDPDTIHELEQVEPPKKSQGSCQGTPWYSILSNTKYSHQFYYVGAFVGEREKLIEIDPKTVATLKPDDEGDFSPEDAAVFEEQSDLIVVLLNLACIPDAVVRNIDFEPGWQKRFKLHMNNWKLNWTGNEEKWRYQDEKLEKAYTTFVEEREALDEDLKADIQEWEDKKAEVKKAALDDGLKDHKAEEGDNTKDKADDDFKKVE